MSAELRTFLSLHFTGARFDAEGGMPVETLGELVAYRDLVVEVARSVFLDSHQGRKRVPKGFTDRLRLRLRQVEEGSAVPVLERPIPFGALVVPKDEFDIGRDLISAAIEAVGEGMPLPDRFPADALVYFNRFGQGLLDDESIELRTPSLTHGPRYTQRTRKALLGGRPSYQREADIAGAVIELDADKMRFQIRRDDGSSVSAPLDIVMFDEVKRALEPAGEGPQVWVSGVGVFDQEDRLVRFDSVHELTPTDSESEDAVTEAIQAADVAEGWFDGDGARTDRAVLERTRALVAALIEQGVPLPRVYPVPDGGVQAEWTIGEREVSVTIEPGGALYVISVNIVSGEATDLTVHDDDPQQVVRIVLPDAS